jgi:hypothetical protein
MRINKALLITVLMLSSSMMLAQTTSFNYQGSLTAAGVPANGNYDLRVGLWDSTSAGTQIGTTQDLPGVSVNAGIFSLTLDFGVNAFPGASRFLEIAVRPIGGGMFTTLAPRQQISSSPYAIRTISAGTADALSSACVACVQDSQINQVSGGKITGQVPVSALPNSGITLAQGSESAPPLSFLGDPTTGIFSSGASTLSISGGVATAMTINRAAVGIGTTTPTHRLSIAGGPAWTSNGWSGSMSISNASALGWEPNPSGQSAGIGHTDGGLYFFRTSSNPGTTSSPANYDMTINDSGNLIEPLGNFGLPKALIHLNDDGTMARCYNGVAGLGGNCGFRSSRPTEGQYVVDFGFPIADRFVVALVEGGTGYNDTVTIATRAGTVIVFSVALAMSSADAQLNIIVF